MNNQRPGPVAYGSAHGHIVRRTPGGVEILDCPYSSLTDALGSGLGAGDLACIPGELDPRIADDSLDPPVQPRTIWAVGLNYPDHAAESTHARKEDGTYPAMFLKSSTSLSGPGDDIVLPAVAPDEVDYEGEIALVVGSSASEVTPEVAASCIFGITAANDVSARDVQRGRFFGGRPDHTRAKSFDTFTPLGPWVVPLEALEGSEVIVETRVNGELRQRGSLSSLNFPLPDLVSFASRFVPLVPGDVILTGTPAGVGQASGRFLAVGDEISVEVSGSGTLINRVRA